MPTGDFYGEVDDFNEWNEIWSQETYEHRIATEAELMVSLEAIREIIVALDYQVDQLVDCVSDNHSDIDDHEERIYSNDEHIQHNGEFIEYQRH